MSDTVSAPGGLDGVVVADTLISRVDGERGRLGIRGRNLELLAERIGFEEMCGLLWDGELPDPETRASLKRNLGAARVLAYEERWRACGALEAEHGMDALRGAVGSLPSDAPPRELQLRVTAAMAVFAAAWLRRRRGEQAVAPDPSRSHAADFLHMAGLCASDAQATALDRYLVTVAEHGMNASTFTARVVASTESDRVSAVVAALGALKGPLHGGAPGPVLDMLDAIGEEANAPEWLQRELEQGRRIMGLGHRIYRVRDPRAAVLEAALAGLEQAGTKSRYLELARAVERAAVSALAERYPDRRLETNVEFYTAILLDAVGLPRELFTPTFAIGRVAGWLAHVEEQRAVGRIIRPRQRYVGPAAVGA